MCISLKWLWSGLSWYYKRWGVHHILSRNRCNEARGKLYQAPNGLLLSLYRYMYKGFNNRNKPPVSSIKVKSDDGGIYNESLGRRWKRGLRWRFYCLISSISVKIRLDKDEEIVIYAWNSNHTNTLYRGILLISDFG